MLESPDYFFRVREIGRLRQTSVQVASAAAEKILSTPSRNPGYVLDSKPLKRGHFGTVAFVLSSEVVLFSEVAPFLASKSYLVCLKIF